MNEKRKLESGTVREAARGRWMPVLSGLCPELEPALANPGRHVGCPVHGGHDGFRLFRDVEISGGGICNTCGASHDGFSLLQWLNGWRVPEALEAVDRVLGGKLPPRAAVRVKQAALPPKPSDSQTRERLRKVWGDTVDWRSPKARPLRDYLAHRGLDAGLLTDVGGAIRFHRGLRYYDDEKNLIGIFPALLALVCDTEGKPVTIHRIYLSAEGRKAPVDAPKKMMPIPSDRQVMGGSIRLGAPSGMAEVIDLAEGIETALAVRQATGLPVWSAVSARLLSGFHPPKGIRLVRVWGDLDRQGVGEQSAILLRDRLAAEGVAVEILLPREEWLGDKKVDWLDVLNRHGIQGFPVLAR